MKKTILSFFLITITFCAFAQLSPAEAEKIIIENENKKEFRYKGLDYHFLITFSEPSEKLSPSKLEELKNKYLPEAYDLSIVYENKNELIFKAPCETDYALVKRFISIVTPTYSDIKKTGYFIKSK